jgi:hypothetical protein
MAMPKENQTAALLDDIEKGIVITFRETPDGNVISRLQVNFVALRKEHHESDDAGTADRKYTETFATDAARGRARAAAIAAAEPRRTNCLILSLAASAQWKAAPPISGEFQTAPKRY